MKPFGIVLNAGARLAFRMARQADSFRIGKIFTLIMPDQACIASTVYEYEFYLSVSSASHLSVILKPVRHLGESFL